MNKYSQKEQIKYGKILIYNDICHGNRKLLTPLQFSQIYLAKTELSQTDLNLNWPEIG